MSDDEKKKIEERQAFYQGEDIGVTYVDGDTEKVFVRQLKIRDIERDDFLTIVDNESQFVEFVCQKPEGWADGLSIESHVDVVNKGLELNRFIWLQRTGRRKSLMTAINANLK